MEHNTDSPITNRQCTELKYMQKLDGGKAWEQGYTYATLDMFLAGTLYKGIRK